MLTDDIPKYILEFDSFVMYEPMTVLTNILLSLVGFWGYKKIKTLRPQLAKGWSYFFFLLGIVSLLGVFTHGVYTQLGVQTYTAVWVLLNILTSIGILLAELNTLRILKLDRKWLRIVLISKCSLACLWLLIYSNLVVTKIHIGIGFIGLILVLSITSFKEKFAKLMVLGLLITVISGILQGQKISIHPLWFNFNDLAHVLICSSVYFVTKGVAELPKSS